MIRCFFYANLRNTEYVILLNRFRKIIKIDGLYYFLFYNERKREKDK